jgi:ABC-2 type transport system permease protein
LKRLGIHALAYAQIAKAELRRSLVHRADLFAEMSLNGVLLVATGYLWRAAYGSHQGEIAGVGRQQMLTYAILAVLLSASFATTVQFTLHNRVRTGDVALDLLRPLNPILAWLAEDVGVAGSRLIAQIPPLLALSLIFFRPALPSSAGAVAAFATSVVLSFLLVWTLSAAVALTTFWTGSIGNLGHLKDATVRFLSGAIVPMWLLPPWLETLSGWLPFPLMYQTPLAIYIGRLSPRQAVPMILLQLAWCGVFTTILAALWRAGRQKLHLQGG